VNHKLICIVVLSLAGGLESCAAVAPWERGDLAKPQVALNHHAMRAALHAHVYSSREAASGAAAASGGGCGCGS